MMNSRESASEWCRRCCCCSPLRTITIIIHTNIHLVICQMFYEATNCRWLGLAGSMAYGFASGVCKRLASETRTLGSCPIRIRNPCVVTTRKDSANTYFLLFIILLRAIELGKTKGCITRVAVSDLSTRQDRSLSSTRHWYLCSNAMQ